MSWSVQGTSQTPEGIRALTEPTFSNAPEASREQFEKAREAAAALAESGAVGGEGKVFNVSLSGHANEGHEPDPNWTKDWVSLNVTQA